MYVNGKYYDNDLYEHSLMRIENAEMKSKGDNVKFVQLMTTRLKLIKHQDKIHCAIQILKNRNHQDVVDIYEGRLLIEEFLKLSKN